MGFTLHPNPGQQIKQNVKKNAKGNTKKPSSIFLKKAV